MTHGHFIGGAAYAANVDALCANFLGMSDHLGVVCVVHNHFGQRRIVAVNNDVDHVLVHNTQISGGVQRLRSTEQNVGELGADHGTAPAVGQAGAQGLMNQCFRHGRAAHVRHVQGLRNFAVDSARRQLVLAPDLLTSLGGTLQEAKAAKGLAEFLKTGQSDFVSDVVDVATLNLDVPLFSDALQLLFVLDGIVAASGAAIQRHGNGTTVIRVRCRTARGKTQVVTANHAVGIATANASRRFSGNAAGAHRADAAAQALLANLAVGTLSSSTSLVGVRANKLRRLKKTGCRSFHLLVRNKNVPRQRTTSTLFFSQQTRLRILPTFPHGKYLGQIIGGF